MSFDVDVRNPKNWISLAARLVVGIVLIWAGASKVTNLDGSIQAVVAYQMLPFEVAKPVGTILPFAEIALGLVLVIGLFTRLAGVCAALLMLAFVIAISSVWARGISIDCGCFGDGGPLEASKAIAKYPWEIARDIGLMACGVWLAIIKKPFLAVDSWLFRSAEDTLARAEGKRRR